MVKLGLTSSPTALSFARNCFRSTKPKRASLCAHLTAALYNDSGADGSEDGADDLNDLFPS